jgi:allantoinase
VEALAAKLGAATGQLRIDVGFWGGVVPGNRHEIAPLHAAGALGFKAFLVDSGVSEFAAVGLDELEAAAREIARLDSVLLVHAEAAERFRAPAAGGDRRAHATWEATRPSESEQRAIEALAGIAARTGVRLHVVHVSSAEGVAAIDEARRAGLPLTGESCPHYLTFVSDEIPAGATEFKCAPPIRGARHREALWGALADGTLALVASDHSPSPPEGKLRERGDFFAAWGGISSLQLSLPLVWTEAAKRGFDLGRVVDWLAAAPARLAGIADRKGAIAVGRDADLVVFDPEARFTVRGDSLYHRHPMTPYEGRELRGRVSRTYLRGLPVFDDGRFPGEVRGEPVPGGRRSPR